MKKYPYFFKLFSLFMFVAIPTLAHAQCNGNGLNERSTFKATKIWPLHPKIKIEATATFQEGSSYSSPVDDTGLYDLYIKLSNSKTGKMIAELCQKGALESDAISLKSISIDTAPYILSETMHAFGVRASYENNSRTNFGSNITITLFGVSAGKLRQLLGTRVTGGRGYEVSLNEECQGTFSDSNSTIGISPNQHNGLSDLLLTEVTNEGEFVQTSSDCVEKSSNRKVTNFILRFSGIEYH